MNPRPGEVWMADLGFAAKYRPVVIVSRQDPDPPRALIFRPWTSPRRRGRGAAVGVVLGAVGGADQRAAMHVFSAYRRRIRILVSKGIAVHAQDADSPGPRLPLLGLPAFRGNGLDFWLDPERRHVTVQSRTWRRPLIRLLCRS
jgi:hypothetical protein